MKTSSRFIGFIAAVCCVVLLSGCINLERRVEEGIVEEFTDPDFYALPTRLDPGDPGELIRFQSILSGPVGALAWRVIYHSRDMAGNDIPVSAVVVVPELPVGKKDRPVVSWGHPTTGSAQKCGPSLNLDPFLFIEGLDSLLEAGYAVVATDYQGMSVAGPSSYLLGVTEGNNVIDAVRAARQLPDSGIGTDVLLWGHSQGGQAALFAAQQFESYAPELTLHGVAVAAPAADLNGLLSDDIIDVSGVSIASYAIPAFEVAYANRFPEADMASILTPAGAAAAPKIAEMCLLTQNKEIHAIAEPLVGGYVTSNPATTEPWATMLAENSAGNAPINVPMFVAQGDSDTLVIPAITSEYVNRLCAAGEHVEFVTYPNTTHGLIATKALPTVVPWLTDALNGNATTSTC